MLLVHLYWPLIQPFHTHSGSSQAAGAMTETSNHFFPLSLTGPSFPQSPFTSYFSHASSVTAAALLSSPKSTLLCRSPWQQRLGGPIIRRLLVLHPSVFDSWFLLTNLSSIQKFTEAFCVRAIPVTWCHVCNTLFWHHNNGARGGHYCPTPLLSDSSITHSLCWQMGSADSSQASISDLLERPYYMNC